jgi:hypothetical protein
MGVRTQQRRQKRKVGGERMDIYVVNETGDKTETWDRAYKTFADALHAVKQYITKLNEEEGYEDEIEKETSREGSENSGLGVAVAHIREGTLGHIYIRKVSVS